MKYIYSTFSLFAIIFLASFSVLAQETQERVVDEVVAQVNDGVITLSRVKREAKAIVDTEVQQGQNPRSGPKSDRRKTGRVDSKPDQ